MRCESVFEILRENGPIRIIRFAIFYTNLSYDYVNLNRANQRFRTLIGGTYCSSPSFAVMTAENIA